MGKQESLPRTWLEEGLFGKTLHMYCDICGKEFRAKVGGIGGFLTSAAGSVLSSTVGYSARKITDGIGRHMVSKEAMNIVKKYLHQCPKCGRWVCDADWNESQNLCKVCTGEYGGQPTEGAIYDLDTAQKEVERAATQAATALSAAAQAAAFNIASTNMITCPHCGQQTPPGKFCVHCGKPLTVTCPNCGATLPYGTKFCPSCGTKIKY